MTTQPVEAIEVPPGFDFTNPDLYANRVPHGEFKWLRENSPVHWNAQSREASSYDDGGFWLLTRHVDTKAVSSARSGWSAEANTAIVSFDGTTVGPDERAVNKEMLLSMDPPRHTALRGIVGRGVFTPRALGRIEEGLLARADLIVRNALEKGTGDFVDDVACELPLQAIAQLIGFPQEDRRKIFDWSNQMIAYDDPDFEVEPAVAAAELLAYAMALGEERRADPQDDIITRLLTADVNGEHLTSEEFAFFVLILSVAGNETTRNAITHGMQAFFDHPEQWEYYKKHRPDTTADEIVRWASPIVAFQRTATEDVEIEGQLIKAGDRVGLAYLAANFDESIFDNPYEFDITRTDNQHVGFGGGGAHYCIGANLARMEINMMFNAIADLMPDISPLGPPKRLRSAWLNGIKSLPVQYV